MPWATLVPVRKGTRGDAWCTVKEPTNNTVGRLTEVAKQRILGGDMNRPGFDAAAV